MKNPKEQFKQKVAAYLPPAALDFCSDLFVAESFQFRVSPDRKSRFGDFRPAQAGAKMPSISVNGSLNPYAFLVTYLHEVAHLQVWKAHQNTVSPHGIEWKKAFKRLLKQMMQRKVFPPAIVAALEEYLKNPAASSCTDAGLFKALRAFDADAANKNPLLESLPYNSHFRLENGRTFVKKERLRKFYRCEELSTGREFRVSPIAEVVPIRKQVGGFQRNEKAQTGNSVLLPPLGTELLKEGRAFLLGDLPPNAHFEVNGKRFVKKEKLRKNFLCIEVATKQEYTIPPTLSVKLLHFEKSAEKPKQEKLSQWQALEELPEGAAFQLEDGRTFVKHEKLRKYFHCKHPETGKSYRISPTVKARLLKE